MTKNHHRECLKSEKSRVMKWSMSLGGAGLWSQGAAFQQAEMRVGSGPAFAKMYLGTGSTALR